MESSDQSNSRKEGAGLESVRDDANRPKFDDTLGDQDIPAKDNLSGLTEAIDQLFTDEREYSIDIAGRKMSVHLGKYARQAGAGIWVQYGETAVLVASTASKEPRQGMDFFPLTVDYEERQYAAGRIPGNFFRREGRPTERAVLACRLTDRCLRPLFPDGFRNDVQVIAMVMSVDGDNSPEMCGILGASLGLTVSDVPFGGPVAAVTVGMVDGELLVNPSHEQLEQTDLHLVVAGTKDAINMVEAGANEVSEDLIVSALELAHDEISRLCEWQLQIQSEVGKGKREIPLFTIDEHIHSQVRQLVSGKLDDVIVGSDKKEREQAMDEVQSECIDHFTEQFSDDQEAELKLKQVKAAYKELVKEKIRSLILDRQVRPDGRKPDEIRPIAAELQILPRVHGSALFTRGQTQALTVATLGTVGDVQMLDNLEDEEFKRYMHHYNFPPFSVGETRPMRGPSRRDVGHGALAERSLEPVLPDEEEFPYTIRLVSEILESNGSTSMASVCGSTLALMDAGVPIKAPVAGIAMGLVSEGDRLAILSDIQGVEDFLGDMDFKVAGTGRGITGLQMDIKIKGINRSILAQALEQARTGRLFILKRMLEAIPEPRAQLSPLAPRIVVMQIDSERIRDVIGPGGKTINKIIAETDVNIDIEDDGRVFIASSDEQAANKAISMIHDLTRDVEVGEIYDGKVTRLMNFGAFCEILPGKEGLIHISQLADRHVNKVEDVVNVGDEVRVKVIEIDNLGRINLSRKEVVKEEGESEPKPAPENNEDDKPSSSRPPRRRRRRR